MVEWEGGRGGVGWDDERVYYFLKMFVWGYSSLEWRFLTILGHKTLKIVILTTNNIKSRYLTTFVIVIFHLPNVVLWR